MKTTLRARARMQRHAHTHTSHTYPHSNRAKLKLLLSFDVHSRCVRVRRLRLVWAPQCARTRVCGPGPDAHPPRPRCPTTTVAHAHAHPHRDGRRAVAAKLSLSSSALPHKVSPVGSARRKRESSAVRAPRPGSKFPAHIAHTKVRFDGA